MLCMTREKVEKKEEREKRGGSIYLSCNVCMFVTIFSQSQNTKGY